MKKVKNLLKLIGMIEEKYRHIQKHDTGFNIFTVLRNESDEVNLHSKFIVELLYKIPHYSPIFLKLFLEEIGLEEGFLGSEVKVLREYKNIDILIKGQNADIIIENKIYAEDQSEQLERYYEEVRKTDRELKLYYLTLDGRDPSKLSLGKKLCSEGKPDDNKMMVENISYEKHISNWVERCIKESALVPGLREALVQYLEVVNRLSGNTENKDMQKEVESLLLTSEDNLKLARQVSKSYENALSSLKLKIWNELEEKMDSVAESLGCKQKYSASKSEKYNRDKVYKNNKYHGLMYEVAKIDENNNLILYFEVDHNFYFGYGIMRNGNRGKYCNETQFLGLKDIIMEVIQNYNNRIDFSPNYSSEWWFVYIYPSKRINYRNPDDNFLKLANKKLWDEFIEEQVDASSEITKEILEKLRGTSWDTVKR